MDSVHGDPCGPGFPIRISADQRPFAGSAQLFAGCHVLLRLSSPRPPPHVVIRLTLSPCRLLSQATQTKVVRALGYRLLSRLCVHVMNNVDTMQYITQCSPYSRVITTPFPTNNYLLSQIVKEPSRWWVWMDSNHRPP